MAPPLQHVRQQGTLFFGSMLREFIERMPLLQPQLTFPRHAHLREPLVLGLPLEVAGARVERPFWYCTDRSPECVNCTRLRHVSSHLLRGTSQIAPASRIAAGRKPLIPQWQGRLWRSGEAVFNFAERYGWLSWQCQAAAAPERLSVLLAPYRQPFALECGCSFRLCILLDYVREEGRNLASRAHVPRRRPAECRRSRPVGRPW